ncbi:MAG: hypothetical protein GC200_12005 [Tepidisphaera sp.]|nr:hypothetical protein [Tepidisphaera sp.]
MSAPSPASPDQTLAALASALARNPADSRAALLQLHLLCSAGRFDDAIAVLHLAILRSPAPGSLYRDGAAMLQDVGLTTQAAALLREALARTPSDPRLLIQLCFALNYIDCDPAEHTALHRRAGELLAPAQRQASLPPPPPGPLRVGFLSSDFFHHPCGTFLLPLLTRLASHDIELHLYSTTPHPDALTDRFRQLPNWRDVAALSYDDIAAQCERDHIHILIETNGWTRGTRLAGYSRRLAPILATYLGYPNTTGIPAMDLRIVDAITDSLDVADSFATERLVRLPGCFLCYQGRPDDPAPQPRPSRPITFGSFNRISKLSDRAAAVWARVLHAVPGSRLLLKSRVQSDALRAAYAAKFAPHAIDASRILFSPYAPDHAQHMSLYNDIDIALDCFPYNGATTTCEALWMGVPVITLAGDTHRARVGASLLHAAGLPELVATTEAEFVNIAATLATDLPRLTTLKASLRDRLQSSDLCNADAHAARFAAALRSIP